MGRPPASRSSRRSEVTGLVAMGAGLLLCATSGGVVASQTRSGWVLFGGAWCSGIVVTAVLAFLMRKRVGSATDSTATAGAQPGRFRRLSGYGLLGLVGSGLLVDGPPTIVFLGLFTGFVTIL